MEMEKARIAIVGLNFGKHIIDSIRTGPASKFFELAAICDIDAQKTDRMSAELAVPGYTDLDHLLRDPSIPAVGLFTGPVGRAELVRKIIRAGKHVMTTKPFELDESAALDVLHEARRLGKAVHLNSPSPLPTADLQQALRWRQMLNLGRPVACQCATWVSYREEADGKWYDDPRLCPVAPIFRLGIYLINDLIRLIGLPRSVQATHSRLFTRRPTPDNAQLTILFEDGAIANIFASFCVNDGRPYENSMTLCFENGTVYRNVGTATKTKPPGMTRMSVVAMMGKEQVREDVLLPQASGEYQWDVFRRAVAGQDLPSEISPEQIVAGIKTVNAMARAEQSGASETL